MADGATPEAIRDAINTASAGVSATGDQRRRRQATGADQRRRRQ
ncbi:flagellin hook IN motif-containing protein [Candidatus Accumulibacter necessarius]